MITRNMKNLCALLPQSSSQVQGVLPVLGVDGIERFLSTNFNFPGARTETFTLVANTEGISFGTDGTPAKETDFNLFNTITSGINVTVTAKTMGVDGGDAPYLKYSLTVTNTSSSAITIREIGYKQKVKAVAYAGGTSAGDVVVLIDRTVLDSPINIGAGDAGVIEYKLKTTPATKYVSGVKIVSWTYGSDADVAAMIDAAKQGTIDLETDGGWAVGDTRTITISAFTGGNNVAHAEQQIDIAISEFSDYNECGSIMQFDFVECLTNGQRMNSSGTNVGGYGSTEMYNTTLPALVNALPEWLKTRLLTFDVLASAGNKSTSIVTVSNNKLALRSEVELFGTHSNSAEGEGQQIEWYRRGSGTRVKRGGRTGSAVHWWERSPNVSFSNIFASVDTSGTASHNGASGAGGVAPFGCI